ncbi:hypothetical protein [Actinomyces sp. oral taxon 172]|uniref:hypothetical protein n=1 Tax=Actinomyces sp. oral taxon 172 TaxID=712118 RepID=UPI000397791B|nr:hypothetical protein [Actinomyces sp. oral taxon 172]ERH23909.1 hypothetical protein HMPREF1980_02001 [Actinomyces sp. oral taxon 172 str. F0311]
MVSSVEIAKPKSNCEADWLKDAGIVGDIRDLWKSKSALDATLNSIGVVADLVDAAVNPIKTGVSWAVNWIISHIAPLPDMLQQFTGDPEKVEAAALTWERIGDQWTQAAAELEAAVAAGLDAQVCRTLSAYKVQIGSVIETFRSLGDACKIVATCLNILSAMVKIVYDLTREAIGDLIGTFVQSVAEAVGTVGLAVPAIIAQISATVSKWVTRITTKGKQVLNGFQEALKSFTKLDGVLEKLGGALKKLFSHVGDVPDKVHDAWKAGKHKVDDLADGVEDAWKAGKHKVDDLADGVEDAWKAGKHKVDDFTDGVKDAWATGKRGVGEFIDDPRAAMKAGGEKAHEFYSSTVRKPIDYMGKPSEYAEEVGKQWGEKATRFIYRGQSAERLEKLDEFFARGDRAIPFKKARDALSDVNDYKELWKKTTEVYGQSGLPSQNKED